MLCIPCRVEYSTLLYVLLRHHKTGSIQVLAVGKRKIFLERGGDRAKRELHFCGLGDFGNFNGFPREGGENSLILLVLFVFCFCSCILTGRLRGCAADPGSYLLYSTYLSRGYAPPGSVHLGGKLMQKKKKRNLPVRSRSRIRCSLQPYGGSSRTLDRVFLLDTNQVYT